MILKHKTTALLEYKEQNVIQLTLNKDKPLVFPQNRTEVQGMISSIMLCQSTWEESNYLILH